MDGLKFTEIMFKSTMKFVPETKTVFHSKNSVFRGRIQLSKDNVGYRMLLRMGWDGMSQLGVRPGPFLDPVQSVNPKVAYYRRYYRSLT